MSPFSRPAFDASGRVIARRALRMGDRTYEPGQELAASDRDQIAPSLLASMWQQGAIDTCPRSEPQGKPAQKR